MNKTSEKVINSLAIIKVNWDQGHDYIDNFVPFIAECLSKSEQEVVSLPDLQNSIKETFGLKIPQNALKTILKRAERNKYILNDKGIYRKNNEALAKFNIVKDREQVIRYHEALIKKLIEFCSKKFNIAWKEEEAESALHAYLEEHSLPILSAASEGLPIQISNNRVKNAEFLVNAFTEDLYKSDPEGVNYLETIVKGRMLADVLLFPELGRVQQHFDNVEIYFDTNFLFRALGYATESLRIPCKELIDMLFEQNTNLKIFEHTLNEMQHILDTAVIILKNPANKKNKKMIYGETISFFINSNYKPSDIEFIIARLPKLLRSIHIQVKEKPLHAELLGLDEKIFESFLKKEVGYLRDEAVRHDIDSLTAIYRLRKGQPEYKIESCRAIFVTTNYSLARASMNYLKDVYSSAAVPICIPDYTLATLVWLKKPLRAPDFPRKRIIADCYAALNPSQYLWNKYLEEIEKLREQGELTEDDYLLLRYSIEAKNALMDLTLGKVEAFTEGTIEEILNKAREAARAETKDELMREREERSKAEIRADSAEATVEAQKKKLLDRILEISEQGGRITSKIFLVFIAIAFIFGFYLTLPEPFSVLLKSEFYATKTWWEELIAPALILIFFIVSVILAIFGASFRSVARIFELWISKTIERFLKKILKVEG